MSVALVVLNPRHVPVCHDSLAQLPITKIRLSGFTERQVMETAMPTVLENHVYDHYIMVADDVIVRAPALWHIVDLLADHPVATGWCQRSHTDWQTNVTRSPLAGEAPTVDAYDFYDARDIISKPEPTFRTWFTGMALTGMSRQMWQRFPFQCFAPEGETKGFASDFKLSLRLQAADIPIVCHRDAFVYHWRHEWRHTNDDRDDRLLLGQTEPRIVVSE